MPNAIEILNEIKRHNPGVDQVRRKYLNKLHQATGRNIICYYSSWLQKQVPGGVNAISDSDKNGFMAVISGLDKSKGLDLVLHTPGGELSAAESIVVYLHSIFGNNIRTVVPQIAMSAGTMIACASNEIVMGKQSNLGPIDPQLGGYSCAGIKDEFVRAAKDIGLNNAYIPLWQQIISRYPPTFIVECEKAMDMSAGIVKRFLADYMFDSTEYDTTRAELSEKIAKELSDHDETKTHSRHIHMDDCIAMGLRIVKMEEYLREKNYQDVLLSLHHAYIHTFGLTGNIKMIENQKGHAVITANA